MSGTKDVKSKRSHLHVQKCSCLCKLILLISVSFFLKDIIHAVFIVFSFSSNEPREMPEVAGASEFEETQNQISLHESEKCESQVNIMSTVKTVG